MFTTGLNVPSPETSTKTKKESPEIANKVKKEEPKKEKKVEVVENGKKDKVREWNMAEIGMEDKPKKKEETAKTR